MTLGSLGDLLDEGSLDVIVQWNPPRTGCRKKLKDIWILYGVSEVTWDGAVRGTSSLILSIAMTASQMRIAETIDAFYGDAGANDGVSRSYKQAVEDLDAETIKALDGPFRYSRLAEGGSVSQQAHQMIDKRSSSQYHGFAHTFLI